MKTLKKLFFLLVFSWVLTSCIETQEIAREKAVIDGWIDSDGFPVVIFTSSLVPGENEITLADKMIRWGKVTISDGIETIILTGGPDKNYFPPYKYVTYQMKGTPGKKYTITADFKDLHAEAECEMPEPSPITTIEVSPIEGNDTLRSASLHFVTPTDVPAYYYITMRDYGDRGRFAPTMLGTYKATEPEKEVSIPLFHPKNHLSDEDFEPMLKVGQIVEVNLCRITREVYDFWLAYDNSVLFGGSQFIDTSQSIVGNIKDGYGVWSAQGVSRALLEVK